MEEFRASPFQRADVNVRRAYSQTLQKSRIALQKPNHPH